MGFWQTIGKQTALASAMANKNIEPIYVPFFYKTQFGTRIQAGDYLYDAEENIIATVSTTVAGHPNDWGFAIMATHTIFALYNSSGIFSDTHRLSCKYNSSITASQFMNLRLFDTDIFDTTAVTGISDWSALLNPLFDKALCCGKYSVTCASPITPFNPNHGILEVIGSVSTDMNYIPLIQKCYMINDNTELRRSVALSGNATVWSTWEIIPSNRVLFDMTSADSAINWGLTSTGMQTIGTVYTSTKLANYSNFRLTFQVWNGSQYEVDTIIFAKKTTSSTLYSSGSYCQYANDNNIIMCNVVMYSNSIVIKKMGYNSMGTGGTWTFNSVSALGWRISKIEGIE